MSRRRLFPPRDGWPDERVSLADAVQQQARRDARWMSHLDDQEALLRQVAAAFAVPSEKLVEPPDAQREDEEPST